MSKKWILYGIGGYLVVAYLVNKTDLVPVVLPFNLLGKVLP